MPSEGGEGYPAGGLAFPGGIPAGFPEVGQPDGGQPGFEGELGGLAWAMQPPKTLRDKAVDAFREGDDAAGFKLLYGHYLADPSAAAELAEKMQWIPGLKRPALGPRIGLIAFYNRPPPGFDASPQPIGSAELAAAMAGVLGGGEAGGGGEEQRPRFARGRRPPLEGGFVPPPDTVSGEAQSTAAGALERLAFFTGELGTRLVEKLEERIARGDYGPIFRELQEEIERPTTGRGVDGEPAEGAAPGSDGGPGGPLAAGLAGVEGTDGPSGQARLPGQGRAAAADRGGWLAMGVVWLGQTSSREELQEIAREAGVDVLITYEISLRVPRAGSLVNNTTRMRVSLVRDDSTWFTSASLENRLVLLNREKGQKGEDPVDKEIGRLLAALDEKLRPAPLPASLTAPVVQQRVTSLVEQRPIDPWAAAVEIRFYSARGLIDTQVALESIAKLIGNTEYAQLLASVPVVSPQQQLGSVMSLPTLMDWVQGVNTATRLIRFAGRPAVPPGEESDVPTGRRLPFRRPPGEP